ncbi:MAG: sarcosine oxidase subunit gamma family protein [Steroidobacteraceae bacterium]|jgi:sarcosine oxidase, subunit gamma
MAERFIVRRGPISTTTQALRLLPGASRYVLRGSSEVMERAVSALGLPFVPRTCRAVSDGTHSALWLGPDELLLLAPEAEQSECMSMLSSALGGVPHSLVDVGHRQCSIELLGASVEPILRTGCPLDLHISAFPVGMCTRTLYAKSEIVLWRTALQAFHVEVWRSYTEYLTALLAQATQEYPSIAH